MSSTQAVTKQQANKLEPFRQAFDLARAHLAQAIPQTVAKYLTPDRLAKITLSAISRNHYLAQCTPQSVLSAVMDAASLGLEPVGPLGQAYLVPYKNKKNGGRYEAQLIIGYRGFIALARRSGEIESVSANVVYSKDAFKLGLADGSVEHSPFMPELPPPEALATMNDRQVEDLMDRGRPIGVYCVAHFKGGGRHVDFMTVGDVERIRRRSRAGDDGPWKSDWEEMARKTVVRRAAKYWPLSTELSAALDREQATEPQLAVVELPDLPMLGAGEQVDEQVDEAPQSKTKQVLAELQGKEPQPAAVTQATSALAEEIRKAEIAKEQKTREQREAEFREKNRKTEKLEDGRVMDADTGEVFDQRLPAGSDD